MIEKHRECLRALNDQQLDLIAQILNMNDPLLIEAIEAHGLTQADIVLTLLRTPGSEARAIVARLAHLHTAPPLHTQPQPHHPPVGEPWVEWVSQDHRQLPGPPIKGRGYRDGRRRVTITPGTTLAALAILGIAPAEVRAAARQGWLRVSHRVRGG